MFGTTTTMKLFFVIFSFMHLARSQTTSLIIPGFDAQPFIGDIIGVDSQSERTTWAIHNGAIDSTFLAEDQFPGVATLIQGPNYVSMNYQFNINSTLPGPGPGPGPGLNEAGTKVPETLAVECILTQSTIGSCSGSAFGTSIAVNPTTFIPLPVLIGSTIPPSTPTSTTSPSPGPGLEVLPTSTTSTSTTVVIFSTTPIVTPSTTISGSGSVNATGTQIPNGAVGNGRPEIGGLISVGMGVGVYMVASFFGYVL